MSASILLGAMLIDAVVGWPQTLYRKVSHPVVWIGAVVSWCDGQFNLAPRARAGGVATVGIVLAASVIPALFLWSLLPEGWLGVMCGALLCWPFLAVRSMHDHVANVARPLAAGDLAGARKAVAMIVGRDPTRLGDDGVARAAIESLAENTSDGIVAPVFWGVVLGLPGLVAYKAINTMDSMIGHRTPRYEAFGWAAARLDDLVNLVPARLTGLLFAVVSGRIAQGWLAMLRDASKHRSPNAGWPEASMAAALGVRLSGPRLYDGVVTDEPWVNDGGRDPGASDLVHALALYRRAMIGLAVALTVLVLV